MNDLNLRASDTPPTTTIVSGLRFMELYDSTSSTQKISLQVFLFLKLAQREAETQKNILCLTFSVFCYLVFVSNNSSRDSAMIQDARTKNNLTTKQSLCISPWYDI